MRQILRISVQVSSSYRVLNRRQYFETRCSFCTPYALPKAFKSKKTPLLCVICNKAYVDIRETQDLNVEMSRTKEKNLLMEETRSVRVFADRRS